MKNYRVLTWCKPSNTGDVYVYQLLDTHVNGGATIPVFLCSPQFRNLSNINSGMPPDMYSGFLSDIYLVILSDVVNSDILSGTYYDIYSSCYLAFYLTCILTFQIWHWAGHSVRVLQGDDSVRGEVVNLGMRPPESQFLVGTLMTWLLLYMAI